MEKKINLVELLKKCPRGMELDCTCADNVVFDKIIEHEQIKCVIGECRDPLILDKYGRLQHICCSKCVIFPKCKTTWEGFVPPYKFKKGDVLVSELGNIVLLSHIDSENIVHYHCIIPTYGSFKIEENTNVGVGRYYECVLANEQQRQRMYEKIKCSGYKYNQQLNKLEKLVEPKFKVGDKVRGKYTNNIYTISRITSTGYELTNGQSFTFNAEDCHELVPNKFDINTLKPFDKVLVRDIDTRDWAASLFSYYGGNGAYKYVCVNNNRYVQCIPYEGNEHLLGKTNDCDDYYKTWE